MTNLITFCPIYRKEKIEQSLLLDPFQILVKEQTLNIQPL